METAKKFKRERGTVVVARTSVGNVVKKSTIAARRNEPAWDVRWFNFKDNKWEREGERLTYKAAYNRAYYLTNQHPYNRFDIVLLPGAKQPVNGNSPATSTK